MGKLLPGLVVSFANQKGGVGKSTFTALYANWFFSELKDSGYRVAVVDCDYQSTLARKREREIASTGKDEKDLFTVIKIPAGAFIDRLDDMKDVYDIILVDVPGSLTQAGVMEVYHFIDIAIVPFRLKENDIDGTLNFWNEYSSVVKNREENGFPTIVRGLITDISVNSAEYRDFKNTDNIQNLMPFKVLDCVVRHKEDFGRYSTTEKKEDKQLNDVFVRLTEIVVSYLDL